MLISISRLERFRYYKNKFPKHSFPFFYYHKINFHLDISIFEQLFLLCFLKYEYFSNWQQSYYRNIGYFEEIYTCENLTFHLHSEKRCKICELDGVYKKCINSLKIAIIIYRCIRNSTKLSIICNSGIILQLDKPKQKKIENHRYYETLVYKCFICQEITYPCQYFIKKWSHWKT
jgi:hypothetical protein